MLAPTRMRASQMLMANHLRDPQQAPSPQIEERRLDIYRGLIYNNIENFISSGFPVLRSLYDDGPWHQLVRHFVREHRCHTPLFPQVSEEFLAFVMQEYEPGDQDPPFLAELAHYEWVELALDISSESLDVDGVDASADMLQGIPVVSPVAWSLAYSYPVHQIGPGNEPTSPGEQPTYLIVYRDRGDRVRFMEANAATARLLQLAQENEAAVGEELLRTLAGELGMAEEVVRDFGRQLLEDFRRQSIVLGVKR